MAKLDCYFWSFDKRRNSTKTPATDGVKYEILLKEETSILSPTIELHAAASEFLGFNYCRLPHFSRYYYITDVRSIAKDTFEVDLTCDVLGTWKTDVLGQSVYANMSSFAYQELIDDERVCPTKNITVSSPEYGNFEIISGGTSALDIPCYQFLSVANNAGLLNGIDIFFGLSMVSDYLQKVTDRNWAQQFGQDISGINPFDAVNEAWWTPLIPQQCHHTGSNSADIYDVAITNQPCLASPLVKAHQDAITIPKPSINDFRFSSKYVKYYLNIPYIGVVTIPTELTHGASAISYSYAGDCLTGQICVAPTIRGVSLGIFGTSLKAPITLARQASHGAQLLSQGIVAAGASAAAGYRAGGANGALIGAVSGFAAGTVHGVMDMPNIDRVGSSVGSIAPLGCRPTLGQMALYMVEAEANVNPATFTAVAGRPTEKVVTLQTGYVQTSGASVHFAGTETEINEFNNALNGGVYFE